METVQSTLLRPRKAASATATFAASRLVAALKEICEEDDFDFLYLAAGMRVATDQFVNQAIAAYAIARCGIAARLAFQTYRVPVSFLIGSAILFSDYGRSDGAIDNNDWFNTIWPKSWPKNLASEMGLQLLNAEEAIRFPSIEACFLFQAMLIATDPKLSPAMAFASDPIKFTHELGTTSSNELGVRLDAELVEEKITSYGLLELDRDPANFHP